MLSPALVFVLIFLLSTSSVGGLLLGGGALDPPVKCGSGKRRCSYFPYNAKLCINGHEYAKRQLARRGIAFEALDNGILSCADPARLQNIWRCHSWRRTSRLIPGLY